jgi:hypothetical protein
MASIIESGHKRNVLSFFELVSYCEDLKDTYQPIDNNIQLSILKEKLAETLGVSDTVQSLKNTYDLALHERFKTFLPVKIFLNNIVNKLRVENASLYTIAHVKSAIRNSKREKILFSENATGLNIEVRKIEATGAIRGTQFKFDCIEKCFGEVLNLLKMENLEGQSELRNLDISFWLIKAEQIKITNAAVLEAADNLCKAMAVRDILLYTPKTGLCDIAFEVKEYIKIILNDERKKLKAINRMPFMNTTLYNVKRHHLYNTNHYRFLK